MIRDYCYVGDVAKANIDALTKGENDVINIGTGKGTRTRALYEIIYGAVKEVRPGTPEELLNLSRHESRPGDIKRSCLRVERAREILGWRSETGLKDGIGLTLKWFAG